MDGAANAINKLLYGNTSAQPSDAPSTDALPSDTQTLPDADSTATTSAGTGSKDTTVEQTVAPAVTHEHVKKEHETVEQEVIEQEIHQDHYHTTIQPLKDQEVKDTKHKHEEAATEYRETNKDTTGAAAKAHQDEAVSGLTDEKTVEQTKDSTTQEAAKVGSNVHHHIHETIQPVIEKETIVPSVTHKTIPVHEKIQEESKDHGVTTREPVSVDAFKHRLDGETTTTTKADAEPSELA